MKKRNVICVAAAALLLLGGCGQQTAAPVASSTAASSAASSSEDGLITPEEGAAILEDRFGTEDELTGNIMSYGYEDTITLDGVDYYNYRISWLVDDHMSYLTNYLVSLDGKTVQEYLPEDTSSDMDLQSAADTVLASMAAGDFATIAAWVGEDGVTFTPYSYADFSVDRTLSAEDLSAFGSSDAISVWGSYDGSGNPIELSDRDYWERFVWNADYTQADTITLNGIAQGGNSIENVAEAYPDCQYVEYHFDAIDPQYEGIDWCSLKLVFRSLDGGWQLVGVIHSEMTL